MWRQSSPDQDRPGPDPPASRSRVSSRSVSQKTTEQANVAADTAVAGANEVAQAAVTEVEDAAVASGLVSKVSDVTSHDLRWLLTFSEIICVCVSLGWEQEEAGPVCEQVPDWSGAGH